MIDFKDFLTREQFHAVYDPYAEKEGLDRESDEYGELLDRHFGALATEMPGPIKRFLEAKSAAGELVLPPNIGDYATSWLVYYRRLIDDPSKLGSHAWHHVIGWFNRCLTDRLLMTKLGASKDAVVGFERAYDEVCAMFTHGTFARVVGDHDQCFESGKRIRVEFDEPWVPVLHTWGANGDEVVEPWKKAGLQTMEFEVKEGKLLCCDWFRAEGFNEHFDNPDEHSDEFNINAVQGAINNTLFHRDRGIIHVSTGNMSVPFYQFGDTVIAGWARDWDEDAEEEINGRPKELGSVCCDLWWVTLIEPWKLREILEPVHGEQTDEKIDGLRWDCEIDLEPGTYEVIFHGRRHLFQEQFVPEEWGVDTHGIGDHKGDELYFVIRKKEDS